LTYKRCSTATHGDPQDNSLVAGLVEEPELAPLLCNSCESNPPESYIKCVIASLSSIPIHSSCKHATKNDCWQKAIEIELLALEENQTWDIVPCSSYVKPLDIKFVFSVKLRSNGSINRYKARLVVLGNKQEYGIVYDETFALVAKMTTMQSILAIVASQAWTLHQMDVKNVFLHNDL
jgi:hypothetical protein